MPSLKKYTGTGRLPVARVFLLPLLSALLLMDAGCKKECNDATDPACPNYDPCSGKRAIRAGFTIREELVYTETDASGNYIRQYDYPETDTVYVANNVMFEATTEHYDSLKWFIGSEVLTDKMIRRRGFPEGRNTQVTLIVYYKSFVACLAGDKWSDTISHTLYAVGALEDIPVSGVYEGYNTDDPGALFTIQVNDTSRNYSGTILGKYGRTGCIQELPKGNTDEDWNKYNGIAWGGKNFFIGHFKDIDTGVTRNYFGMYGKGSLSAGTIQITYSYDDNGYQHFLTGIGKPGIFYVTKTFIGKKIRPY